jgi:hypothetical protein
MKKLLLVIAACFTACLANAQQLKSDGSIVDSHNSTIGYLKNDGTVEDSHHSTIGYIKKDGTIEDSHHSTIGYLKSDGTMENSHHSSIKKVGTNKMEDVLKQFFFK